MKHSLIVFTALLRASLASLQAAHTPQFTRPNVILIVADDLGYGDLGCYAGKVVPALHLDALARSGIRMTPFYVASAVCSPTRASVITGGHPLRFDIRSHLRGISATIWDAASGKATPTANSAGRLVVPVWLSTGTGSGAHQPSVTATIYSDDGGKTWLAGDIAVPNTDDWINPNETVAVELADGCAMLNVRNESKTHRRLVTTSPDGATGWSTPQFDEALLEPICMAGLVRYEHGGKGLLLFSNPHNLVRADGKVEAGKNRDRRNVSAKVSRDEGRTWNISKTIEPGPSACSNIAVTKSGTILCRYGRGGRPHPVGDALTLARFNLEWLEEP